MRNPNPYPTFLALSPYIRIPGRLGTVPFTKNIRGNKNNQPRLDLY